MTRWGCSWTVSLHGAVHWTGRTDIGVLMGRSVVLGAAVQQALLLEDALGARHAMLQQDNSRDAPFSAYIRTRGVLRPTSAGSQQCHSPD